MNFVTEDLTSKSKIKIKVPYDPMFEQFTNLGLIAAYTVSTEPKE